MSGTRRFFNISESADIRINELLDNLETLRIEYSSDEFLGDERGRYKWVWHYLVFNR